MVAHPMTILASYSAPKCSRQRCKSFTSSVVLSSCMQHDRHSRQCWKPKLKTNIKCTKWDHTRRQCGNAKPRHDRRGNCHDTATNEYFAPGDPCFTQKLRGHRSYATGFCHGRQWQRLAHTVLPTRACKPAKLLLDNHFSIISTRVIANDDGIELSAIIPLKKIIRRSNPNFYKQFRIVRVHACDQCWKFRPGDMVAYPDGETLPCLSNHQ